MIDNAVLIVDFIIISIYEYLSPVVASYAKKTTSMHCITHTLQVYSYVSRNVLGMNTLLKINCR